MGRWRTSASPGARPSPRWRRTPRGAESSRPHITTATRQTISASRQADSGTNAGVHGRKTGTVRQQTPRHQASRAHSNFIALGPLVPPRVHCAVWGCIWNRWTTAARFQRRHQSRCLLCGGEGSEDNITHYSRCRVVRRLMGTRLRLNAQVFSGMHAWVLCSPPARRARSPPD